MRFFYFRFESEINFENHLEKITQFRIKYGIDSLDPHCDKKKYLPEGNSANQVLRTPKITAKLNCAVKKLETSDLTRKFKARKKAPQQNISKSKLVSSSFRGKKQLRIGKRNEYVGSVTISNKSFYAQ